MKLFTSKAVACMVSLFSIASAKSSWTFDDATVAISAKGAGVGGATSKEKFTAKSPVSSQLTFDSTSTLKLSLTTLDSSKPARPHQAFLTLTDASSALSESFPLEVKTTGKATLSLTHKDLPIQLATSQSPLKASLILASFGSSTPFRTEVFTVSVAPSSPSAPVSESEPPIRYGKRPEIHHVFKDNPRSPPAIITAVFSLAVVAALPVLIGVWMTIGFNLDHLSDAFGTAPLAYSFFIGSIVAIEGVFMLYYINWSLFQILPVLAVISPVAFVSGSRALREVQGRRLAGKR